MINNFLNWFKLKIFFVLILSFFISSFLKNELFIADTPQLKMLPHEYIASKIQRFLYIAKYGKKVLEEEKKPFTPAESTLRNMREVAFEPLKKISQGTYAQQKGNVVRVIIKEEEIEWVEYRFRVNGKERIIRVPKDQKPPTQKEVEQMFLNEGNK